MKHNFERALVTGATSGIGEAFAQEIPSLCDLLLTGRNTQRLHAIADEVARGNRTVDTLVADLANEADVHRVAQWADEQEIDLLINNAGVGHLGRFLDHPVDDERATVAVNVVAVLLLTRLLLPGMVARANASGNRAGIIIVSSSAAFSAVPYFASYAATKAFDLSFAEALSEEMRGQPVDVMALCPGATRTAFGTRAGFSQASFPGAADPRTVVRDGLRALGRQTVKVSGLVEKAAIGPMLRPRGALTGVIGTAMRVVSKTMLRPAAPPSEAPL